MAKLAVGVPEAAEMVGIGRSTLYNLFRSGEIKAVKSGKRRLVKVEELQRYVDSLPAAEA